MAFCRPWGTCIRLRFLPDVPEAHGAKMSGEFRCGLSTISIRDAARSAGVEVTNTPGAVTDATADIAMTLMLMSARRAGEGERMVRANAWEGWHPTQMLGLHLSGKHVGIVGMGRIGQAIARRCHFGFGMTVSYLTRSRKDDGFPATQVEMLVHWPRRSMFLWWPCRVARLHI